MRHEVTSRIVDLIDLYSTAYAVAGLSSNNFDLPDGGLVSPADGREPSAKILIGSWNVFCCTGVRPIGFILPIW